MRKRICQIWALFVIYMLDYRLLHCSSSVLCTYFLQSVIYQPWKHWLWHIAKLALWLDHWLPLWSFTYIYWITALKSEMTAFSWIKKVYSAFCYSAFPFYPWFHYMPMWWWYIVASPWWTCLCWDFGRRWWWPAFYWSSIWCFYLAPYLNHHVWCYPGWPLQFSYGCPTLSYEA